MKLKTFCDRVFVWGLAVSLACNIPPAYGWIPQNNVVTLVGLITIIVAGAAGITAAGIKKFGKLPST